MAAATPPGRNERRRDARADGTPAKLKHQRREYEIDWLELALAGGDIAADKLKTLKAAGVAALRLREVCRIYVGAHHARHFCACEPVEAIASGAADHRDRLRCMVLYEALKCVREIGRLRHLRQGHVPLVVRKRNLKPWVHRVRLDLLSRQLRPAHERLVDGVGGLPPLADGPNHERLPAPHVARGEHLGPGGAIVELVRLHIAAAVEFNLEATKSCPHAPAKRSPWRAAPDRPRS